ncbi:transmembrane protein 225B [Macrotis lagotis]|uniref:transmembrane protein 225B n=1 Tax=Macrotis lagotis TaxID=92651 RepID=UPI003D69C0CC
MEIIPHFLEERSLKTSSETGTRAPTCPTHIQYSISKRNLLNLRVMAVSLTILSWLLMFVVCTNHGWVTLEHSQMEIFVNQTLNFALWDNCLKCLVPGKMPVFLFMSRGLMFLNLIFTTLLIISMLCSFRRMFSRISKLDFIFSISNYVSGLTMFLSILLFGLQVMEIFSQEGRNFHFKWPIYLSGFGVLCFIGAGTICFNSHRHAWSISFLFPKQLITESKNQVLTENLGKQSASSGFHRDLITSSSMTAILHSEDLIK